jgi:hypothetical protein
MRYETKRPGLVGLCLAAMLMASMALAGTAAAEGPFWSLCLEGSASTTKYSSNQCTKAESGGKWESAALGEKSVTVKLSALTLRVTDTNVPLIGTTTVVCPHPTTGWGTIEKSDVLIVRSAKVEHPSTECAVTAGTSLCETSGLEKVEAADLPWKVEIFGPITKVEADGGGEPGWKVECKATTDTCLAESTEKSELIELKNNVSAGALLVLGALETAGAVKCSQGGENSGEVGGELAITSWNGVGLSLTSLEPWMKSENVGGVGYRGPAGAPECVFTAVNQKCKLKFENITDPAKNITVIIGRIAGIGHGHGPTYTRSAAGCTVSLNLNHGASCEDEILITSYVANQRDPYCLLVRPTAGGPAFQEICADLLT